MILKEICKVYGGYAFDSKKMSSVKSKYQIIKMGNLYNGIFDLDRNPSYIEEITEDEKEYLIKQGDILITLTGTQNKQDYGYTVYINENMNTLLNQRCAFIKSHNINAKYLFYLLNSNRFKIQFFSSSTGGTGNQANVSTKDIENFSMFVPFKSEQNIIANFLTRIDERIKTQNKIIKDLEILKNAISQYVFGDHSIIKLSWTKVKLLSILRERKQYETKDSAYSHATLSKEGIYAKTDRYNRDFLVKDEEKEYKVTHLNDICYNPANLNLRRKVCLKYLSLYSRGFRLTIDSK